MSTSWKRSSSTLALGLSLVLVAGCGAESDEAGAADTVQAATAANESPAAAVTEPEVNPENPLARKGGRRYESGFQTLESEYDLSKLNVSGEAAPTAAVVDEHAGHDHGPTGDVEPQGPVAGGGIQPAGVRYLGGIQMAEGSEKSHDFGMIRAGESRAHTFEFISDGKEPLVIRGVKPSCGCTRADVELVDDEGNSVEYERNSPIPIGQHFRLLTEMSTEGKKGQIGATVSIYTNAAGGAFNVRLMAEVEPVLEVEPETSVFFGQITTAEQREQTVTIRSKQGEPFALTADNAGVDQVQVVLEAIEPDADGRAKEWTAKVVAGPGLPVGIRNYPCILTSDIEMPSKSTAEDAPKKYHTVPLAVQARVTGLVHAEPAFVGFGMVRPGEIVQRSVRVESFDDFKLSAETPVTIEGLYGGEFEYADSISTSASVIEEGKFLDLTVTLSGLPDEVNGSFGGVIKIAVGHPSMEELLIRFTGVCRANLTRPAGN